MSSRTDPSILASVTRIPRAVVAWSPVWVPLAICVQVALLGLRPALEERERLETEAHALVVRYDELATERVELDRILQAQSDPLFVERERRALLDPTSDLR